MALLVPSQAFAFDFLPDAEGFNTSIDDGVGAPTTDAGTHPYRLTFNVDFEDAGPPSDHGLRDLNFKMPPGLFENPTATGQQYCNATEFKTPRSSPWEASKSGESCKDKTQVGTLTVRSAPGGPAETE